MNELTDEQKKDVEERVKQFMERYDSLVGELQMSFVYYPMYLPRPDGTFSTIVQLSPQDRKYLQIPSPLQP